MQNILVTGANGLLATNIIKLLIEKGYSVIGLLRRAESYIGMTDKKLTLVEGDFTNSSTLDRILPQCDAVIHAAALTSQGISSYQPYYEINVKATESLVKSSIKHQVKKFIYVSTANVFGYGTKTSPGNETRPQKHPFTLSNYAKSKAESEKRMAIYSGKIDIITVNPTFLLGAYDGKPSSGRIILMALRKKIIFYPPGGKNFIHVEDAAEGVIKAMKIGKPNENYLLAGENLSYYEFLKKLINITGQKSILVRIPSLVLKIAGFFGSLLQKSGIAADLNLVNAKILTIENYYSNDKAEKNLGLKVRPIEMAINDSINWFSNQEKNRKNNKKNMQ
ncbi:NAD-dependent epimerase/dehydratase family protein [Alkalitalea saponilacus]|uniref:NAD dependent epimerase/dehydratase family protein n=1 Tax=Alkalitalea saponilacus TaxID=889453 RepID=A0A1T5A308_9BACT|nr:NAD-dependent epimerase/dehydratase family protein [Alkalitalea saponilacus]ASB48880.1 NAD-dependent dehydratase [Alkalitalea saponilacus]SKB29360.1 NAD dependent epimerase/dehydratase family protein [Alkalitalea saponilacus]